MTVPGLKALLAELDGETHGERVRRMALLGRDDAGSAKLGALLDQLGEMGGYWHRLALEAAVAARDAGRVVAALSSPSGQVRSFAYSHLVAAGVDVASQADAYAAASSFERRRLGRMICSTGRPDVAERLITLHRAQFGDREAAALLAGCSGPFVASMLAELDHAVANWAVLGRRHPVEVLDHFEARARSATRCERDGLWRLMAGGIRAAYDEEPERVLALLERFGPSSGAVGVLGVRLGALLRAFPSRATALVLRPDQLDELRRRGLPRGVLTNAAALPSDARLAFAVAVRDEPVHLATFLDRLPPSERAWLFTAVYNGVDTSRVVWPDVLLEALPAGARAAETRRMIALREVGENPVRSLAMAAFLPIAEARAVLEGALGAAEADDRATAYALLVQCTRRSRSPEQMGVTLAVLGRLRNEQDPVRLAAVAALAEVPAHLFADELLPGLLEIVTSVVEARDSSWATVHHLRRLMLDLLRHTPAGAPAVRLDAALAGLNTLAGPAGTMAFGQIGRLLPRGVERDLLAALLPRIVEDARRDRFALTLSLASGLDRRGWDLDALQLLVGQATRAPSDATVRRAIELWLAPPGPRGDRVGQLVANDPSTLTLAPVVRAVTTRRQDLLDVLLRPQPIKGRFLTGNVRHVPIILDHLDRWLPRQHNAYADALAQLIRDTAPKPWIRASALRALSRLPGVGGARLEPLLASPDVSVVEAALAGLAWTDQPDQELLRLLAFADGDRARVAIYAATRCARFASPPTLMSALGSVLASPTSKITARKEAVRLLAQHRPPGGLDRLMTLAADGTLHRDVRIAVGRSLRSFLDDPRVWPVLASLAAGSPDETRSLLDTAPFGVAVRHRARFGQLIVGATSHPEPRTRMAAFSALGMWVPWLADAADIAARSVQDLTSGMAWRPALRSLVVAFADGRAASVTASLIERLATTNDPEQFDAGEERDLPSRQRLAALVDQLTNLSGAVRIHVRDDLASCAAALAAHPTALGWEAALVLSAADLAALTEPMRLLVARLAERPIAAVAVAKILTAALEHNASQWQPDDVIAPVDYLFAEASPAAVLLAVAIIAAAGPRSGWSPDWRSRLRTIRQIADPDLADGALALVTVPE